MARHTVGVRRQLHHSIRRSVRRHRTKEFAFVGGTRRLVDLVRVADYADVELDGTHDERIGGEHRVGGESEGIFGNADRGKNFLYITFKFIPFFVGAGYHL